MTLLAHAVLWALAFYGMVNVAGDVADTLAAWRQRRHQWTPAARLDAARRELRTPRSVR